MAAFLETLTQIVFPSFCVLCEKRTGDGDQWLCETCQRHLPWASHWVTRTLEGLDGVWSFDRYAHQGIRQLIHAWKFQSAFHIRETMGALVSVRSRPIALLPTDTLTWIPASEKRKRERGFDHGLVLADTFRQIFYPRIPLQSILYRVRETEQNALLPADRSRATNVRGLFHASQPITGSVMIVDDVITTGVTIQEAATVLRAAGASHVYALSFASGE